MSPRVVKFAKDCAVSVGVAVLALLLLEVVLRVAFPQNERFHNLGDADMAIPDDTLGHRYRPLSSARHITPEFDVEYKINRRGHRDATPYEAVKDPHRVRVLVLGDSFTFGHGADYGDTWVVVMERELAAASVAVDVINAGIQGYDTRTEYLYLRRLIDDVKPDLVLLAFLPNDLFTNEHPDSITTGSQSSRSGRSFPQLHVVTLAKRLLLRNDYAYCRTYLITARRQYYASDPGYKLKRALTATEDLLVMTDRTCEEHGAAFAVLSIPQFFQVIVRAQGFEFKGIDVDHIDAVLGSFASSHGFGWYETLNVLAHDYSLSSTPMYHRIDGHLSVTGNAVVGQEAARMVTGLVADIVKKSNDVEKQ